MSSEAASRASLLSRLENISSRVNRLFALWLSGALTLAVALMMAVDSIMRSFFNKPLLGVEDMCEILMVWICLAALGYALVNGSHVRVTALLEILSPRKKLILEAIASLIGFGTFAFVAYYGWFYFWDSYIIKEAAMRATEAPVWLAKPIVPISSFLLAFQFALNLARSIQGLAQKPSPQTALELK